MSHATLLMAGGGTGGHVFPMVAVADALRDIAPDLRLVFVGTERGLEAKVVPERGYELELMDVAPLRGGGLSEFDRAVQFQRAVQIESPKRDEARSAPAARLLDARAIAERIAAATGAEKSGLDLLP